MVTPVDAKRNGQNEASPDANALGPDTRIRMHAHWHLCQIPEDTW
jgi:hypothetical protein